jgi:hypothetical protein
MINVSILSITFIVLYFIGILINLSFILDILKDIFYGNHYENTLFMKEYEGFELYLSYLLDILILLLLLSGSFFTTPIILNFIREND